MSPKTIHRKIQDLNRQIVALMNKRSDLEMKLPQNRQLVRSVQVGTSTFEVFKDENGHQYAIHNAPV